MLSLLPYSLNLFALSSSPNALSSRLYHSPFRKIAHQEMIHMAQMMISFHLHLHLHTIQYMYITIPFQVKESVLMSNTNDYSYIFQSFNYNTTTPSSNPAYAASVSINATMENEATKNMEEHTNTTFRITRGNAQGQNYSIKLIAIANTNGRNHLKKLCNKSQTKSKLSLNRNKRTE